MKVISPFLILVVGIGMGFSVAKVNQPTKIDSVECPTIKINSKNKSIEEIHEKPGTPVLLPFPLPSQSESIASLKEKFDDLMNQENLEKANKVLMDMERTNPNSRQFLEGRGRYLVRTRDYENAKTVLLKCLISDSRSKSCLIDLADVELEIGTKEDKEKAATACLSSYPNDPQCGNDLGMAKMNQGKYEDAVSIYEDLLRRNGDGNFRFDEALLHSQLAYALQGSGRLADAYQHFESACRFNPDYLDACRQADILRAKL